MEIFWFGTNWVGCSVTNCVAISWRGVVGSSWKVGKIVVGKAEGNKIARHQQMDCKIQQESTLCVGTSDSTPKDDGLENERKNVLWPDGVLNKGSYSSWIALYAKSIIFISTAWLVEKWY